MGELIVVSQDRIEGSWQEVVGAIQEKYGEISGDELARLRGSVEQLIGYLQRSTGDSRERIESMLTRCCQSAEQTVRHVSDEAAEYAQFADETVSEHCARAVGVVTSGYRETVEQLKRRPVETLAMAGGLGALAGLLVGLSLSNRR